ncbi:MAG: glucose-6-phosphate isomerase [Opitutales bacterium]|nr:glucose-6-phosphate isomerase [Opitutales bacterium]MCH8541131.1 glucose-6-phosphate isomerase [Opitutales bacterium]
MSENWKNFRTTLYRDESTGFALDVSRMGLPDNYLKSQEKAWRKAFSAMEALEAGAISNPDEERMVGHYWLRNPERAPSKEITQAIASTLEAMEAFVSKVHRAELSGESGPFINLLVIGIGGSALGPQFVSQALGRDDKDKLTPWFFDNTDPEGMDRVLGHLNGQLGRTLVLVISKSGGTPETRNGMLEAARAYERAGLAFAPHAVAITGEDSALHQRAKEEKWLATFPMWDWVGGRTSETGPVGLLPAALQGIDIRAFLSGAATMDDLTRESELGNNPAALLAFSWLHATNGKGEKDMVILPYKDRLELFSKYLQQLVMESLGKEKDLDGKVVHQGIAVYGNKGSTDQHAYVQQLREGVPNFFAVFIEVLLDRNGDSIAVDEEGMTSGDYLHGFYLGTRQALSENGRPSLTITLPQVDCGGVGSLIALFERAVGFYASLVNVNAYHQPGVEAGKKAASSILQRKKEIRTLLSTQKEALTVAQIAKKLSSADEETIYRLLCHLAANQAIEVEKSAKWWENKYQGRKSS